jgi:hypothetical protein
MFFFVRKDNPFPLTVVWKKPKEIAGNVPEGEQSSEKNEAKKENIEI